ncbi:hypothetical protein KP509_31G037600 [Ceratopteris richardii]|uniref:Uncharacterized protein n=1 Tax=Ceratopteris richardii TaxID=49495 RepID=A0A8T2QX63_CERRI|nr:hypothetical protein KP509_31G037600 [Ceratopteris richardii]
MSRLSMGLHNLLTLETLYILLVLSCERHK